MLKIIMLYTPFIGKNVILYKNGFKSPGLLQFKNFPTSTILFFTFFLTLVSFFAFSGKKHFLKLGWCLKKTHCTHITLNFSKNKQWISLKQSIENVIIRCKESSFSTLSTSVLFTINFSLSTSTHTIGLIFLSIGG